MKGKWISFSLLISLLIVLTGAPARAGIQTGVEWRLEDNGLTANSIQLGWDFRNWRISSTYNNQNGDLEAGLVYKTKQTTNFTSWAGIGFRDLLNSSEMNYNLREKAELITGISIGPSKGLALSIEARIVPNTLFDGSNSDDRLAPVIGVSLIYRSGGGGAPPRVRAPEKISEADFYLLAKLITAEAGGEPYLGQVAVGAVVFNRVNSGVFPNSIRGVIYQSGQFSSLPKLPAIEPTESSLRAAREALLGNDPTDGALYFYNPETCSQAGLQFFRSGKLRQTVRIGNHVFLK